MSNEKWIVVIFICLFAFIIFAIVYERRQKKHRATWGQRTEAEFNRRWKTRPDYTRIPIPQILTRLAPEQEAEIPKFVEKWCRIAFSVEPAERSKAEQAMGTIYQYLGLQPPQIVWCTSPLASGLTRALVQRLPKTIPDSTKNIEQTYELAHYYHRYSEIDRPLTSAEVWQQARDRVTASLNQNFWESVKNSVEASQEKYAGENIASRIRRAKPPDLGVQSLAHYRDNNWDMVQHTVRCSVRERNWRIVRNRIEDIISARIAGVIEGINVSITNGVKVSESESKEDEARANSKDYDYSGEFFEIETPTNEGPVQFVTDYKKEKVRVKYSLGENPGDSIGNSIRASVWNSCYGQHDAGRLAVFDYFRSICGLETQTDKMRGQWELAQSAGWYLPHEYICWICERPSIVNLNSSNQLHCENGPALSYPDDWSIYALNGVVMKPEYILIQPDQLDPAIILKESNVDIRRELLRKIGISRMLIYGKEVDSQGNYKLIDMSPIFGKNEWDQNRIEYAPYLLMQSPSIEGAQHLEGVSPECRTVEQAINWRASEVAKNWKPDQSSPCS